MNPTEHLLRLILRRLDEIEYKCDRILQGEKHMSQALDDLTAQVAANTAVEQSAIVMIQGLASQIQAAATDPAKISALASQLHSSASALAAAITANTPAAPVAPPAPAS